MSDQTPAPDPEDYEKTDDGIVREVGEELPEADEGDNEGDHSDDEDVDLEDDDI